MLRAEKIDKTFRQGTKTVNAVRSTGITVSEAERVYIHGPSGAGKSTLLQIFGGLNRPTSGRMLFRGEDIYAVSDIRRSRMRNRNFGFIFQFYHLLPELSVLENVMLPAMIAGRGRKNIKERALSLIERVGLTGRMKHRPSQISGGEAQRTAIARALMNGPEVLFCDEPTGNLDSAMSAQVYSLIKDISDENGMSVVVVSHQEIIEGFADSEYIMKDGVLHEAAARAEIRTA